MTVGVQCSHGPACSPLRRSVGRSGRHSRLGFFVPRITRSEPKPRPAREAWGGELFRRGTSTHQQSLSTHVALAPTRTLSAPVQLQFGFASCLPHRFFTEPSPIHLALQSTRVRLYHLQATIAHDQENRRAMDCLSQLNVRGFDSSFSSQRSGSSRLATDKILWRSKCTGTELNGENMERGSVARNTRAEARCSNDVSHDAICINIAGGIETCFARERETKQ